MGTFLIICTVLGTVGLFLHFLSAYDKTKLDKLEKQRTDKDENFEGADPKLVYGKNWNSKVQRPRICPCCGKALKKTEFLYASMGKETDVSGKKQVNIYGCRYCYLGLTEETQTVNESLDF